MSAGIHYAFSQLINRLGIFDISESSFQINGSTFFLQYCSIDQANPEKKGMVVVPCAEDAWEKLLEKAPNSLHKIPVKKLIPMGSSLTFTNSLPVLFWGKDLDKENYPFAKLNDNGQLIFYADILSATLFMLSRWEEAVGHRHDDHGRFPASASTAFKQGFLDLPIVDQYAMILGEWIKSLFPAWQPKLRKFEVKLSHDIDLIKFPALIKIGGDLIKRRSIMKAKQTIRDIRQYEGDLYWSSIKNLAELSENNQFRSTFFLMTGDKGKLDSGYFSNSNQFYQLIEFFRNRQHEIGLHASYESFDNPERLLLEKKRMDDILGYENYGGRQHYLRFSVPDTWRMWEKAGLEYDSTMGYASQEGFRCGTCHPYNPFDIESNRQLDIFEVPLIVMDGTLAEYQRMSPEVGAARILELARKCQEVNGLFTLLWHNTSFFGKWKPWSEQYKSLLPLLKRMETE